MSGDADQAHGPILAAIELLGQRWMLRVVWELEPGPLGFLELRRRMGNCSSSMLSNGVDARRPEVTRADGSGRS